MATENRSTVLPFIALASQEDQFRQRMEEFLLPMASEVLHAQESNAVPAAWPAIRVE